MKNAVKIYYFFLPLLLLCGFYAYKAGDFEIHDFSNYYFGGKFLAGGNFDSTIYFPHKFNQAIAALGYQDIFASYAPNTPFLALFFVPFSLFSVTIAKLVFNCISIGLFVFSVYRLFNFYKVNPKFALLIPLLFLIPIKNNLLFGQVYFLLFFLLAEGWIAYERKHFKSMAFFWSFAILLKVFPVILIVPLVFKKDWKALVYLLLSCFLLFGISLFFTGIDIWIFFFESVLPKASNGEIATAFVDNYQSVFMFLKRLLVYDSIENPMAIFNYPVLFLALIAAFKIGFIVLGFFITRKSTTSLQILGFWVLAMILLSPYGSTYTFILLVFPFLTLIKSDISDVKKVVFCLMLLGICNFPLSVFLTESFPISYLRLSLLLVFFILFLMQLKQKINWKVITIISFVPLVFVLIFRKEEASSPKHFLMRNNPILIYDYKILNGQLTYFYWDKNGENKRTLKLCKPDFELLKITDNQIFYHNRQLTFDKSNKLKPVLINKEAVLYLTDYGRGIGFYALKKIELGGK